MKIKYVISSIVGLCLLVSICYSQNRTKDIDQIEGNIKYNSTLIIKFVLSPKSTIISRIIPL